MPKKENISLSQKLILILRVPYLIEEIKSEQAWLTPKDYWCYCHQQVHLEPVLKRKSSIPYMPIRPLAGELSEDFWNWKTNGLFV